MITKFRIRDFKGHRDTQLDLGRFTMLVGDNASGKTSVLEALALQGFFGGDPNTNLQENPSVGNFRRRGADGVIQLSSEGTFRGNSWTTTLEFRTTPAKKSGLDEWRLDLQGQLGQMRLDGFAGWTREEGKNEDGAWSADLVSLVGTTPVYRLHAASIAAAAYNDQTAVTIGADGTDTAVVLAEMKLADDDAFHRVEQGLRRLVPAVEHIRIRRATVARSSGEDVVGSKIYFDFRAAPGVPGDGASHGTLILVSLLTILHRSQRPNVILLDDFDHALHPRAQVELVRTIKQLLELEEFKDLQIVATTHSPYMLDELEPQDIQAFALRDDGTVACKRLSEHPEAARTQGALTAGQLWSLDPERDWVMKG